MPRCSSWWFTNEYIYPWLLQKRGFLWRTSFVLVLNIFLLYRWLTLVFYYSETHSIFPTFIQLKIAIFFHSLDRLSNIFSLILDDRQLLKLKLSSKFLRVYFFAVKRWQNNNPNGTRYICRKFLSSPSDCLRIFIFFWFGIKQKRMTHIYSCYACAVNRVTII